MKIKLTETQIKNLKLHLLNEEKSSNPIDVKKLIEYANAIEVMCDGEYGITYFNESENKVWIMLGDSNPFDEEYLIEYMKGAIADGWKNTDKIDIECGDECGPIGNGWKQIKKGKLIDF